MALCSVLSLASLKDPAETGEGVKPWRDVGEGELGSVYLEVGLFLTQSRAPRPIINGL